ncbi:MAG TPA: glycosyltransferase [Gemmataceae bacterium]|jgi:glycosyltransferase involved in cell wall biosynthesis|nr:glycosyltransferase [Gemmataceae bacterium]
MPLRILHVVGSMDRGGIETWLMHVLRHTDRDRFAMDFLVHTTRPGAYDEEIRALGGRILRCLRPSRPWAYARCFRRILRECGPYDVVHSHVHHYSGHVLRLAHRAGVPVRIAHSHLDSSGLRPHSGLFRRFYLDLMQRWIDRDSTVGLAASRQAAGALFGPHWQANSRRRLLYCGIDLAPFRTPVDPAAERAALGIPGDAFVMGHVGRFTDQKNHRFLVTIAAEVAVREPRARLLLIGDGPLRPAIEQGVQQAGLAGRVLFAGSRPDVARLMRGVMDVFVMPSLYEGLPLVGMEAQAAGLTLVVSDTITPELDVIPELVQRRSLNEPASVWAQAVLAARDGPSLGKHEALAAMEKSPFDIHQSVTELEQVYAGGVRAS